MIANLEQRLDEMKQQIDALQILVAGRSPWYEDVSLWVAIIALVFSSGTTLFSYYRMHEQDILNLRQELRGLLQRLSTLPRENVENIKKYEADPAAMTAIGGFINQENTLLARQAAEIARKLPAKSVSAVEYYSVAIALQNAYDLEGAGEFLEKATQFAKDFNTEIAAIRMKANLKFLQGHAEGGRVEYQRALDIFSKYPGYDPFTKLSAHVWTELAWANSEASLSGPQGGALQHLENAERLLDAAMPSPGVAKLREQVLQARALMTTGAIRAVAGPQLGAAPSAN